MEGLIPHIRAWFADKEEHISAFTATDCRVEGWFKGELLVLFTRLKTVGILSDFEREASAPAAGQFVRVDFRLLIPGERYLCELKALCISQAAGTRAQSELLFP